MLQDTFPQFSRGFVHLLRVVRLYLNHRTTLGLYRLLLHVSRERLIDLHIFVFRTSGSLLIVEYLADTIIVVLKPLLSNSVASLNHIVCDIGEPFSISLFLVEVSH